MLEIKHFAYHHPLLPSQFLLLAKEGMLTKVCVLLDHNCDQHSLLFYMAKGFLPSYSLFFH